MTTLTPVDVMRHRFETKVARVLKVPVLFEGANGYWINGRTVTSLPENCETFIRYAFKPASTNQSSFGNVGTQHERTVGVIMIQTNVQVGVGTGDLRRTAINIGANFRRVTVGGITYKTPFISAPRRRGKWWAIVTRCPVTFFESTAPSEV